MAGRHSILTDKIIDQARQHTAAGHFAITVCNALGISERSWYSWLETGRNALDSDEDLTEYQEKCMQFLQAIKSGEAEAEMRHVKRIEQASVGTWQASAWYLERKHKERWGRNERQEGGNASETALDRFLGGIEALANKKEEGQ